MRYVTKVVVEGFWGNHRVAVDIFPDVTFFIGPNGSGKTTLINLIAAALTADYRTLDRISFEKITISLSGEKKKPPQIVVNKNVSVGNQVIGYELIHDEPGKPSRYSLDEIEIRRMMRRSVTDPRYAPESPWRVYGPQQTSQVGLNFSEELASIVNVNWLSVDRTLNEERSRDGRSYESIIDFRLESLSNKLVRYLSKNSQEQDNKIRQFQQDVLLSVIDLPNNAANPFSPQVANIENAKKIAETLEKTFRAAKIEEERIRNYVDKFKISSEAAIKNYNEIDMTKPLSGRSSLTKAQIRIINEYFAVSHKMAQSSTIVQMASDLQEQLNMIQSRRNLFIETANNLFLNKQMIINSSNEILFQTRSGKELIPQALSSGEKQMLVLLSEMFLQDGQKSILIADEPELSLHVSWQEKLIDSLKSLNPHGQIIVATHSPDIVGRRADRVISVDEVVS
jgi:energy-coupling factor transporter ATP-binding protein EcfA2